MEPSDFAKSLNNVSQQALNAVADETAREWLESGGVFKATREGFDKQYELERAKGIVNPEARVELIAKAFEEALKDPQALEAAAHFVANMSKNPELVRSVDEMAPQFGIPQDHIDRMWGETLHFEEPIDPRLTQSEKDLVRTISHVAKYAAEKGYLQTTLAEAPLDSKWARETKLRAQNRGSSEISGR